MQCDSESVDPRLATLANAGLPVAALAALANLLPLPGGAVAAEDVFQAARVLRAWLDDQDAAAAAFDTWLGAAGPQRNAEALRADFRRSHGRVKHAHWSELLRVVGELPAEPKAALRVAAARLASHNGGSFWLAGRTAATLLSLCRPTGAKPVSHRTAAGLLRELIGTGEWRIVQAAMGRKAAVYTVTDGGFPEPPMEDMP